MYINPLTLCYCIAHILYKNIRHTDILKLLSFDYLFFTETQNERIEGFVWLMTEVSMTSLVKVWEEKRDDDLKVDPSSTPSKCCSVAPKFKLFNSFFHVNRATKKKKLHDEIGFPEWSGGKAALGCL